MILAIYLLAVILLVSGIAGLISAINLVPTDLGFTYFQAGATSISAGVVVLAIGLAAKVLDRSLKRLATPEAIRVQPADPVIDLPPLAVTPPEPPTAEGNLGKGIAIAGVAAAAGAVAATAFASSEPVAREVEIPAPAFPEVPLLVAGVPEEHLPEPLLTGEPVADAAPRPRTVEDLERDLFAQMDALPEPPPVAIPEADVAPAAEPDPVPMPRPDLFVLPPLEPIPQASFAEPGKVSMPAVEPLPPATGDPFDAVLAEALPAQEARSAHEEKPVEMPAVAETPAEVSPVVLTPEPATAAAPVPGLIHDADFAAVADEMLPALAPVSTLEIIGAYDSGGTRFTMYSDGSVVAAGPDSERRFRSLDELRLHIDSGQI